MVQPTRQPRRSKTFKALKSTGRRRPIGSPVQVLRFCGTHTHEVKQMTSQSRASKLNLHTATMCVKNSSTTRPVQPKTTHLVAVVCCLESCLSASCQTNMFGSKVLPCSQQSGAPWSQFYELASPSLGPKRPSALTCPPSSDSLSWWPITNSWVISKTHVSSYFPGFHDLFIMNHSITAVLYNSDQCFSCIKSLHKLDRSGNDKCYLSSRFSEVDIYSPPFIQTQQTQSGRFYKLRSAQRDILCLSLLIFPRICAQ